MPKTASKSLRVTVLAAALIFLPAIGIPSATVKAVTIPAHAMIKAVSKIAVTQTCFDGHGARARKV